MEKTKRLGLGASEPDAVLRLSAKDGRSPRCLVACAILSSCWYRASVAAFMRGVYGWMCGGLAITAATGTSGAGYIDTPQQRVLIESHGDFTDSPTLSQILSRADSPNVGLLWDAHHTFVSGKEEPEFTVQQLGKFIRHTHLKDSVPSGDSLPGNERRYVLTGHGDVRQVFGEHLLPQLRKLHGRAGLIKPANHSPGLFE